MEVDSLKEKLLELESRIIKLSDVFASFKRLNVVRNESIDKMLENEFKRQWDYLKSEEFLFKND